MKTVAVREGERNKIWGPPRNWDQQKDGTCGDLTTRVDDYNGHEEYVSAWRPSEGELELLNRGGVVELGCLGIQPPVRLTVVQDGYFKDGV
jgi:hypothetical protein